MTLLDDRLPRSGDRVIARVTMTDLGDRLPRVIGGSKYDSLR